MRLSPVAGAAAAVALLYAAVAAAAAPPPPQLGLGLQTCGPHSSHWKDAQGTLRWNSTLCLTMPQRVVAAGLLRLAPCVTGDAAQAWTLSSDRHLQNPGSKLCATAKGSNGGTTSVGDVVDVWQCQPKSNEQFALADGMLSLPALTPKLCVGPSAHATPPPAPTPAPPGPVTVDLAATGRLWEGLGGLSAGASSRLLLDYKEPQRSQILDLLFKP
jgi:hypothetical protein|eukprot:COSAG06_NODE_2580_length_6620_cov_7.408373_11_plen_215_part_00